MKSRLLWTVLTYPCLVSLVSAKNGKGALLISFLLFSTIAKCYSPFLLDRLHTVTALCLGIGLWVHVSAEKGSNWVQRWLSLKKSRTSQYFPISIQMNLSLINIAQRINEKITNFKKTLSRFARPWMILPWFVIFLSREAKLKNEPLIVWWTVRIIALKRSYITLAFRASLFADISDETHLLYNDWII